MESQDIELDKMVINLTTEEKLKTLSIQPNQSYATTDPNNETNISALIDKKILAKYPVGSKYFQYDGDQSPASLFGGTWNKIAESVSIPLGSIVQTESNGNDFTLKVDNSYFAFRTAMNATTAEQANVQFWCYEGGDIAYRTMRYRAGIQVDLNKAENKLTNVNIWERIS